MTQHPYGYSQPIAAGSSQGSREGTAIITATTSCQAGGGAGKGRLVIFFNTVINGVSSNLARCSTTRSAHSPVDTSPANWSPPSCVLERIHQAGLATVGKPDHHDQGKVSVGAPVGQL